MAHKETKKIRFKVFRYNPEKDYAPRWQEYELEVDKGTTVLDALLRIKEEQDPTLVTRYSCRQAVCGSCGMMINGKQRLACFTRVLELNSEEVEVAPLKNYRIIKDLVTDFSDLFAKEKLIAPYIVRDDEEEVKNPTGMYIQKPEELLNYLQFADCIECGLCMSACPTVSTDPLFLGPMILNRAYRFSADSRDGGLDKRLPAIDSEHGCWRCHFAAACSNVCPKGIDPAKAIQFLKRMVTGRSLLKHIKYGTSVVFSRSHAVFEPKLPEEW